MKRTEEQKRNMTDEGRKAFYMSLVSKLNETKIYEPFELNDVICEVINEQGGSQVHRSQYITNLTKIIGEKNYDMIEDENARTRGRSKKYLFSLKAEKKVLYNIIDEYFKPKRSAAVEKPAAKEIKAEPKEIRKEPEQPKESGLRVPSRISGSAEKLWTILSEAIRKKKAVIDFEQIGRMLGISYHPTRTMFEKWISYLKEAGIHIEYLYKTDGRTTQIVLKNPENSLLNLAKGMKEKYNKNYDTSTVLGMRPVEKKIVEKNEVEEKTTYSESAFLKLSVGQKKTLWHIAGVIMEYGNRPLDLLTIGKRLHEEFGIDVSASQIRSLVMTTSAFTVIKTGHESRIQLRINSNDEGREAYEFLKLIISPVASKSSILARLSMTLEEVREYLPESTVESEITPNDNIFKLVFNSTKRDWIMLSILVMSRRGTDKFFDKGIIEFAKNKINSIHELLMKHDSDYRIENI